MVIKKTEEINKQQCDLIINRFMLPQLKQGVPLFLSSTKFIHRLRAGYPASKYINVCEISFPTLLSFILKIHQTQSEQSTSCVCGLWFPVGSNRTCYVEIIV